MEESLTSGMMERDRRTNAWAMAMAFGVGALAFLIGVAIGGTAVVESALISLGVALVSAGWLWRFVEVLRNRARRSFELVDGVMPNTKAVVAVSVDWAIPATLAIAGVSVAASVMLLSNRPLVGDLLVAVGTGIGLTAYATLVELAVYRVVVQAAVEAAPSLKSRVDESETKQRETSAVKRGRASRERDRKRWWSDKPGRGWPVPTLVAVGSDPSDRRYVACWLRSQEPGEYAHRFPPTIAPLRLDRWINRRRSSRQVTDWAIKRSFPIRPDLEQPSSFSPSDAEIRKAIRRARPFRRVRNSDVSQVRERFLRARAHTDASFGIASDEWSAVAVTPGDLVVEIRWCAAAVFAPDDGRRTPLLRIQDLELTHVWPNSGRPRYARRRWWQDQPRIIWENEELRAQTVSFTNHGKFQESVAKLDNHSAHAELVDAVFLAVYLGDQAFMIRHYGSRYESRFRRHLAYTYAKQYPAWDSVAPPLRGYWDNDRYNIREYRV